MDKNKSSKKGSGGSSEHNGALLENIEGPLRKKYEPS